VRDEIVPTAGSEIWETGGSLKIGMDADGGFSIIRCDRSVSTRREDSGTEASDAVIRGGAAILPYYENIGGFHLSSCIIAKSRTIM